jgi:hypothetical protein
LATAVRGDWVIRDWWEVEAKPRIAA